MIGWPARPPDRIEVRSGAWLDAKTGGLLLGLLALAAAVGYLLLGGWGVAMGALAIALLGTGARLPPQLAMKMQGAVPLGPWDRPGLQEMVARLARRAGVPSPRLYWVPTPEANAFTVGAAADGGAIAVSEGALALLRPAELEGILAHEVAHLRNGDTAMLRLAGTTSHVMTLLLIVSMWLALPVVFVGGLSTDSLLSIAALAIGAPAAVTLLVAALSRTRELAADAVAATLTGDPLALAAALGKMERQHKRWFGPLLLGRPEVPELLRSHPATETRVERLRAMAPTRRRPAATYTPARKPAPPRPHLFPVWRDR